MSILTLRNISKRYGSLQALREVSFEVPRGSVFGILGPNGSGKTTLLGIVTDVLKADTGDFTLFDQLPTAAQRRQIGTLLETPNFYHYLSGYKNLQITAAVKRRDEKDIARVLEIAGLTARQHAAFKTYSLGMKQRLAIANTLLGDPDVLILDEPSNGLDPAGIAEVRALIKQLAQSGKTIIMASHLLDEVEKVCTHVAVLQKGKLLTSGPVNTVMVREDFVELGSKDMSGLETIIRQHPLFGNLAAADGVLQVFFTGTVEPGELNSWLAGNGIWLNHLQVRRKSLESAFLEMTQN
ncbi:ATP-binding cassette domain-containing protein [Chitinophaga sp.]|uniref:ABC transporter ATP-binding protein n=1 Tax=Chitinophaga sp. TaxID=1869181 RepID=UPI0031CE0F27